MGALAFCGACLVCVYGGPPLLCHEFIAVVVVWRLLFGFLVASFFLVVCDLWGGGGEVLVGEMCVKRRRKFFVFV